MLSAVTGAIDILKSFLELLKGVSDWDKAKVEKNKTMIVALGNASAQTADALKLLRDGDKAALKAREMEIGKLWNEAAAMLHDVDKDMAITLFAKAQAWRNAEDWTTNDYNIAMDNLNKIDDFVKKIIKS
jgi:hypothetical protein